MHTLRQNQQDGTWFISTTDQPDFPIIDNLSFKEAIHTVNFLNGGLSKYGIYKIMTVHGDLKNDHNASEPFLPPEAKKGK